MPPDKDDPWRDSILRSPSPASSDAADDGPQAGGFVQLAHDNDLLRELDLSRREDHAIVRETPFTLARLRAQHQASKGASRDADARVGGGIRTAVPDDDQPSLSQNASRKAAPKKRKTANTGWTDSNGEALDAGPITKKGKRGVQREVSRSSAVAKKAPAPKPAKAPAKNGKAKRKDASEDKIEFRKLPTITSHSDFPILAGLERQRSLPKKKPTKKSDPPTNTTKQAEPSSKRSEPSSSRAGVSKARQTKLDIGALITGYKSKDKGKGKGKAPSPPARPSSSADTDPAPLDLNAALEKEFGPLRTRDSFQSTAAQPKLPAPAKSIAAGNPKLFAPADAGKAEVVDLTALDSSTIKGGSPIPDLARSPRRGGREASRKPPDLKRPIAERHNVVPLLETLAAQHNFPSPQFKSASRLPPSDEQLEGTAYQPPMRDVETAFLIQHGLFDRPNVDEKPANDAPEWDDVFPYEQPPSWHQDYPGGIYSASRRDSPGPSRSTRSIVPGNERQRESSQGGRGLYDQDWQPTPESDRHPADLEAGRAPYPLYSQSPRDQWGRGRTDPDRAPARLPRSYSPNTSIFGGGTVSGTSARAPNRPAQQRPSSRAAFASEPYRPALPRVPRPPSSAGYSPAALADPRHHITPTSAYTATKRKPRKGTWNDFIRSPSPLDVPKEWTTLPPKRQRVTLRPEMSHPKSSRFRLPPSLFSGSSQPQPAPGEPSVYSGEVTITKWTPSALSQPSASAERSPARGYVPPNLRALEHLEEGGSPQNGRRAHSTPSRHAPYFTPTPARHATNRNGIAYPTPRSLPGPIGGLGEEDDDDSDDWADAWRLSANGRGAVGGPGG